MELKNACGGGRGHYHCWAMTASKKIKNTFSKMVIGDEVLFKPNGTNNYEFIARVVHKLNCKDMGDALWPYVPGDPWALIYFLDKIEQLALPKEPINEALGYKRGFNVQGTQIVKRDRIQSIIQTYGSFRSFLKSDDKERARPTTSILLVSDDSAEQNKHIKPAFLMNVISNIETLRNDPNHQECDHEALVESFFEANGWSRTEEIRFQRSIMSVGRLDVSIGHGGDSFIVTEVKRDWNLTTANTQAIDQGYKYANHLGAKLVVITNGDFYAVFDRDKGRSIKENFRCEFWLTSLEENHLNCIKVLQKNS